MAETRPYVINANVIKLLNSAPVPNMRPSLGSFVQRKTIDIGCYPFPFMVNSENVPLDGRTIIVNGESTRLPIRPVPYWCSENTYARYYGDPTYNNGIISWAGKIGYLKSKIAGNDIKGLSAFEYDSVMGVSFPSVRYNTAFIGMNNTVSQEWIDVRNAAFAPGGFEDVLFSQGSTLAIAENILFKIWSGVTFEVRDATDPNGGVTYGFLPMEQFINKGGTYSGFFARYNYGCLEEIFNSDRFATIGLSPNDFWDGQGVSYGVSGGMTGELFLLNAVTAGNNSGSLYIETAGASIDFPYSVLLAGGGGGKTLSGRQLALNLYGLGNDSPFIGSGDPNGGFVETMAMLLGTNQKITTLISGQTASLRALDFNNPCSASFVYRNDTELGRWGYDVLPIGLGGDVYTPGPPPEIGCNVPTFVRYLQGATAQAHGNIHPMAWMFWKGIPNDAGNVGSYSEGFIHDFVGLDDALDPIYNKLEGIHDHLCYEIQDNTETVISRVYYPLRPITKAYYDTNIAPLYNVNLDSGPLAQAFGVTLSTKYDTAFPDVFKGEGSVNIVDGAISLRNLDAVAAGITIDFGEVTSLNGITGIMFPYLIPLASFAMNGIGSGKGDLVINGEFSRFDGSWTKDKFNIPNDPSTPLMELYPYYADGVSSGVNTNSINDPYSIELNQDPNFKLFSWNALTRISPRDFTNPSSIIRASFKVSGASDRLGKVEYKNGNVLTFDGTDVDVDALHYPPNSLPASAFEGLTFNLNGANTPLECASFINVIRYANITAPNEEFIPGAFGLTAERRLISQVDLGANRLSFIAFDPLQSTDVVPNEAKIFDRTGNAITVANRSDDFFATNTTGQHPNFFFSTPADDQTLGVFNASYYLTAQEYFDKYVSANTQVNWWENINMHGLCDEVVFDYPEINTNNSITRYISSNLLNPNSMGWNNSTNTPIGFRGTEYNSNDTEGAGGFIIGGVKQALLDGLHPAFVYRIFTTDVLKNLGSEEENSCIQTWRSLNGTPCDQIPSVKTDLTENGAVYNSYFQFPQDPHSGCGNVGNVFPSSEFEAQKGKDFFGQCMLAVSSSGPGGGAPVYAYDDYYHSPIPNTDPNANPYFKYQNIACDAANGISDPPIDASLTAFGTEFATAINTVEGNSVDLTDTLAVRDTLFAFPGNTASLDGTNNSVGPIRVANWLQGKLKSIFDYWNDHRTDQQIAGFLTTIYGTRFPAYQATFANAFRYRLFAIKPKCVGEWTPDCSALGETVQNTNSYRSSAYASSAMFFEDEVQNADIPSSNKIGRMVATFRSQNQNTQNTNNLIPQTTTSDIRPLNEGFVGAFNTFYLEPAGQALNVIASEIQTISRAVVASTVFGKLGTVIDSTGFIRDVNVITFESGFGTKILGDNTTGNISFSVTGLTLGSLEDTNITEPATGDILVYDAELGKWINVPFSEMNDLQDPNFYYQSTPPTAGITAGSRWMDSDTGAEYIYINDGNSIQWIQAF